MPEASIVRILLISTPSNRRAHSAPMWSNSSTSHWWLRKASTLRTLPAFTMPSRRIRSSSSCMAQPFLAVIIPRDEQTLHDSLPRTDPHLPHKPRRTIKPQDQSIWDGALLTTFMSPFPSFPTDLRRMLATKSAHLLRLT